MWITLWTASAFLLVTFLWRGFIPRQGRCGRLVYSIRTMQLAVPFHSAHLHMCQHATCTSCHDPTTADACRSKWKVEDVPVGPQPEQYLHTTSGGVQDGPPLVLCPGYGAGTGFYFRSDRVREPASDLLTYWEGGLNILGGRLRV
jgi:hypothetical protein